MNKTKIEWTDYTWNSVTGCKRDCWYCYVKRIKNYDRTPTFHEDRLEQPYGVKDPSRIFVCSTADLFGNWIPDEWIAKVLRIADKCSWHTFLFLTKNPLRYCDFVFLDNQWIGITHTGETQKGYVYNGEMDSKVIIAFEEHKNTFLSCEPLLGDSISIPTKCKWLIIGAMTGQDRTYQPKIKWIKNLLLQADKLNIPVFMKNNLREVWKGKLRQEFPR